MVQFAAIPTLTSVLGNLGTAAYLHPALLLALVAGLKGKFGVTEDGAEEEERQVRARRVCAVVCVLKVCVVRVVWASPVCVLRIVCMVCMVCIVCVA